MKNKISILLIIIFLGMFIYGFYNIILYVNSTNENNEIQKVIETKIEDSEEENIITALKEINSDVVGYLTVNNTRIDYPVVKTNNNDYYLTHNLNKKSNSAGWIFMDYRNNFDNTDKNIVIYGHNMLNGSMFGTLKSTHKKEWYTNKDNLKIKLIKEDGIDYYEVFSLYKVSKEDYYIKTDFKDDLEFEKFIKIITKRSIYNFNVEVLGEDTILTLSTCSGNGTTRTVLHAKKI
jgi:sortase B